MKEYLTVREHGKITLPESIMNQLNVKEGDRLELSADERGEIRVTPVTPLPEDPAWFRVEKRPGDERETSEAITSGRVKSFDNADDAIKWLESDEAKAWADAIARNYGHHDPTLR